MTVGEIRDISENALNCAIDGIKQQTIDSEYNISEGQAIGQLLIAARARRYKKRIELFGALKGEITAARHNAVSENLEALKGNIEALACVADNLNDLF